MTTTRALLDEGVDRLRAAGFETPRLIPSCSWRTRSASSGRPSWRTARRRSGPTPRRRSGHRLPVVPTGSRSPTSAGSRSSTASRWRSTSGRSSLDPRPSMSSISCWRKSWPGSRHGPGPGTTEPLRIVDVGTGSGAIAIALAVGLRARRVPADEVAIAAVDVSADALDLARENAVGHAVGDRVTFENADLLPPSSSACVLGCRGGEPPVRPLRRDGLAPDADDLRACGGARWRTRRAGGDRAPAGRAPRRPRRGRNRVPGDRRRPGRGDRGAGRRATAGLDLPVATDLAGLPRTAVLRRPVAWRSSSRRRAPEFPIRLIALDIDGTLIGDDHDIGPRTWRRSERPCSATSRSRSSPAGWCRRRCDSRASWT